MIEQQINKNILAFACGQQMFCRCKAALDVDSAVNLDVQRDGRTTGNTTVCAKCYDAAKAKLASIPGTLTVIDGRELKGVRISK